MAERFIGQAENVVNDFNERMSEVKRLNDLKEYIKNNPEAVTQAFFDYHYILKSVFKLQEEEGRQDKKRIKKVNDALGNHRLDIFFKIVGDDKERFHRALNKLTTDTSNNLNKDGLKQLTEMMILANDHRNKLEESGHKARPIDGEEPWDSMIWGFTNGAIDPIIDLHFVVAHGINRIFAQEYKKEIEKLGLSKVIQKDWLVNMMTEMLILKHLKGESRADRLYQIWKPKRPNGLGWVSDKREKLYKKYFFIN